MTMPGKEIFSKFNIKHWQNFKFENKIPRLIKTEKVCGNLISWIIQWLHFSFKVVKKFWCSNSLLKKAWAFISAKIFKFFVRIDQKNLFSLCVLHVLFLGGEKSENNHHYHHSELSHKQSRVSTAKR